MGVLLKAFLHRDIVLLNTVIWLLNNVTKVSCLWFTTVITAMRNKKIKMSVKLLNNCRRLSIRKMISILSKMEINFLSWKLNLIWLPISNCPSVDLYNPERTQWPPAGKQLANHLTCPKMLCKTNHLFKQTVYAILQIVQLWVLKLCIYAVTNIMSAFQFMMWCRRPNQIIIWIILQRYLLIICSRRLKIFTFIHETFVFKHKMFEENCIISWMIL